MDLSNLGLESVITPSQEFVSQFLVPELVGSTLALVLSGICIPNLVAYYNNFPKDNMRNKVAVSTVGLGMVLYIVLQQFFVIRMGSTRAHTLKTLITSDTDSSLLSIAYILITVPSELVLAEQAWRLNKKNKLLGAWLLLFITASFASLVATMTYTLLAQKNFFAYGSALFITIPVCLISYLVTDLSIVLGILIGLRRTSNGMVLGAKSRSRYGGARLVKAILQTSIESAVFPTVINIVTLALHYYNRTSVYFVAPSFILNPVYCLTLLYSLNRRRAHLKASRFDSSMPSCLTGLQPTNTTLPVSNSTKARQIDSSVAVVLPQALTQSWRSCSDDTHRCSPMEEKFKNLPMTMRVLPRRPDPVRVEMPLE